MREERLRECEKKAHGDEEWEYDVLELVEEVRRLKRVLASPTDAPTDVAQLRRPWQDGVFDAVDEPSPLHACANRDALGNAINCCYELEPDTPKQPGCKAGQYWVAGPRTESQVNYCPYCGAKAPVQIEGAIERPG